MLTCVPEEAFKSGILNKEFHERLLVDIDAVIEVAGIPPEYLWSRLSEHCRVDEVEWMKNIRKHTNHGLALVNGGQKGKPAKPAIDRMMALTGACLRNYIDSRVMPLQDVLARLKDDAMPSPTVLMIPNFCLSQNDGGHIAPWQISALLGLLYSRLSKNLKTVVYVSSLDAVEKAYGESFRQHLEAHFQLD